MLKLVEASVRPQAARSIEFVPEPFDSEVLGLRIGRIASAHASGTADYQDLFTGVAISALADGYQQVLRRVGLTSMSEVWALERTGFELMDVGVTFARALAEPIAMPVHEHLTVRASTDDDLEAITEAMVAIPWQSRYEADPAYRADRVRELRRRWLWNSHRGRADVVLIGEMDGAPAGYVTCRLDRADGSGEIELVGTLPRFRGRGVAGATLASAIAWFSTRARVVTVRTQATNTAAATLYERAGFTLRNTDLTYRLTLTPAALQRDCS